MSFRTQLILTAVSGFLAVALGAFGAHALKTLLEPGLYTAYQTGVEYHFYHTLVLFLTALAAERFRSPAFALAGWAFLIGILLFCGSLYLMALTGVRQLGMVTPVGGVSFLVGWALLGYASWTLNRGNNNADRAER